MCLYFLDLLQYEHFRREIVNSQCVKFIDDQAILLWQHYTRRRMKLLAAAQQNQQNGQSQNLSNGHQQNGNSSPTQTVTAVANGGEQSGNGGGGSKWDDFKWIMYLYILHYDSIVMYCIDFFDQFKTIDSFFEEHKYIRLVERIGCSFDR